jgi:hypothetical protein
MRGSHPSGRALDYWQKPRGVQVPLVGGGQSVGSLWGPEVPVYVHDFVHSTEEPMDAQRL